MFHFYAFLNVIFSSTMATVSRICYAALCISTLAWPGNMAKVLYIRNTKRSSGGHHNKGKQNAHLLNTYLNGLVFTLCLNYNIKAAIISGETSIHWRPYRLIVRKSPGLGSTIWNYYLQAGIELQHTRAPCKRRPRTPTILDLICPKSWP